MNLNVFSEKMKDYAQKIEIELTDMQIEKFYTYMKLLLEWNEKINLTAITDEEEIISKHFIDSITISKNIPQGAELIDVGTGAGFPGIPLKIVREDIKIVLLDSLNKRINFLNAVIEELNLTNIEAIHGRAEEFARNKKYREHFDIATSRAVANLATLSEYLIPLLKIGGKAICMKGSTVDEEIIKAKNAIKILGGRIAETNKFELPETDIKRCIIIIHKEKNTSSTYPRKAGTPAKEPLS